MERGEKDEDGEEGAPTYGCACCLVGFGVSEGREMMRERKMTCVLCCGGRLVNEC